MKRQDLLFAAIVVLVVAGLIYLSITGRHPQPTVKNIPEHQNLQALTPRAKCLECHDPQNGSIVDKSKRIQEKHPEKWKDEKFSCLKCHTLQKDSSNASLLMILNSAQTK
ncbi:MAG: hypothetical protein JNN15_14145 [Blastocatellia bacterium]|nr:hypothetical protein [Blastocatellia bacterium]